MTTQRYHPILIGLHWLLALLILVNLIYGGAVLAHMPNETAEKISALGVHMILGGVIGLLTLLRLIVRVKTDKPAPASSGNALFDRLAPVVHALLYLLVLLMVASGIGISILAGLPDIVFGASRVPLPHSLDIYLPHAAHGLFAKIFLLAIALHVAAALYHQFILLNVLLNRMRWRR